MIENIMVNTYSLMQMCQLVAQLNFIVAGYFQKVVAINKLYTFYIYELYYLQ